MITVIARMTAKDGDGPALEQVMAELAGQVRAKEQGCALYQLCKTQEPHKYVMIERYADQQALSTHTQTEYFRAAMPKLGALLEGRAQIELLTEVG